MKPEDFERLLGSHEAALMEALVNIQATLVQIRRVRADFDEFMRQDAEAKGGAAP